MDWLIPLLFVLCSIMLPAFADKKKKREAEEKRARQVRQAQQNGDYADANAGGNAGGKRPPHPYAESAKDKGMTLDDFRRRYESGGYVCKPQTQAKPAASRPTAAQTARAERTEKPQQQPQSKTARQPQPKSAAANAQKPQTVEVQRTKQNTAAKPQMNKSVPVTGVDIGSQAKESPMMAGVMANKNDLHTEFGADAVAFVQSKNLSPMQQGLLWAEILGAPKAKRQRGGRF